MSIFPVIRWQLTGAQLGEAPGLAERLWITITRRVRAGHTPATVRSQLRSLDAKTGTAGQVEFVRVAALTQAPEP